MADNLTTTTTVSTIPDATVIATDDAGAGGHVQLVKLAISTDGSATALTADNSDGLLVNLGTNNDVTVTSGTITANLGATDNAVLDAISAATVATQAAVEGTLTVASHAVTNAGTFVVQEDGAALTALQLIDDIIYVDDTATHATGTTKGAGIMAAATPTDTSIDANDIGMLAMSTDRRLHVDSQIVGQDADVTIADGGNSITIDGTITANLSATDNAVLDSIATATVATQAAVEGTLTVGPHAVTNAGTFATQATLQANSGVDIGDVDVTSIIPGTGATNLGKIEDAAHTTGDVGVMTLAVQQTADAALAGTSGDYAPLQVDDTGYLKVNVKAGGGTGGTSDTDDSAFTAGSGSGTPAMGFFSVDTVDSGDVGVLAMDASRRLLVSIEADNAGIGGGTQYAVDTALGATPTGTLAVAIRDDALSALTPVEGDAVGQRVDANGALWVIHSGTVTVDGSGVTQPISGTVTANLSATDNAVLDQIEVNTSYGDNTGGGVEAGSLRVTLANDSTGLLSVDDNGGSLTVDGTVTANPTNTISTNNSTTSTLGISATYTGTGDDVTNYSAVTIQLDSSHDSATDGMTFQFSIDDTNWDDVYTFTYTAADGARRFQYPVTAQYFRVVYTNGGTGQSHFRMQTILHRADVDTSIHRLVDSVDPDRSAHLLKTAIIAQAAGSGDFVPIAATAGGNLKMSVQEFSDGVDVGNGAVGSETLRVTVASDSTGSLAVTNAGTFVVQEDGAALTALQLLDDVVSTLGTTTYTETTTKGNIIGVVRNDTLAALANTDNEIAPLQVNATGALYVEVDSSALPAGAATAAAQLADGHNVTVDNAAGASAVNIQDGGNSITIDGTVTANLSATDNAVLDQIELNTSYGDNVGNGTAAGSLRVTVASDTTGVLSVDDNGGSLTIDGTVTASNTAGDIAHDAADSGNPVKVGGKAVNFDGTAPGTAVAEADRVNFITDVYGRQLVETAHPNHFSASVDYATAQTNATVKAAAGAGLKLYITDIVVSNGATAGNITLLDGSGGTVMIELYPAINGGMAMPFKTPIALTANTLLAITSTTVTTHSVTVSGYVAP